MSALGASGDAGPSKNSRRGSAMHEVIVIDSSSEESKVESDDSSDNDLQSMLRTAQRKLAGQATASGSKGGPFTGSSPTKGKSRQQAPKPVHALPNAGPVDLTMSSDDDSLRIVKKVQKVQKVPLGQVKSPIKRPRRILSESSEEAGERPPPAKFEDQDQGRRRQTTSPDNDDDDGSPIKPDSPPMRYLAKKRSRRPGPPRMSQPTQPPSAQSTQTPIAPSVRPVDRERIRLIVSPDSDSEDEGQSKSAPTSSTRPIGNLVPSGPDIARGKGKGRQEEQAAPGSWTNPTPVVMPGKKRPKEKAAPSDEELQFPPGDWINPSPIKTPKSRPPPSMESPAQQESNFPVASSSKHKATPDEVAQPVSGGESDASIKLFKRRPRPTNTMEPTPQSGPDHSAGSTGKKKASLEVEPEYPLGDWRNPAPVKLPGPRPSATPGSALAPKPAQPIDNRDSTSDVPTPGLSKPGTVRAKPRAVQRVASANSTTDSVLEGCASSSHAAAPQRKFKPPADEPGSWGNPMLVTNSLSRPGKSAPGGSSTKKPGPIASKDDPGLLTGLKRGNASGSKGQSGRKKMRRIPTSSPEDSPDPAPAPAPPPPAQTSTPIPAVKKKLGPSWATEPSPRTTPAQARPTVPQKPVSPPEQSSNPPAPPNPLPTRERNLTVQEQEQGEVANPSDSSPTGMSTPANEEEAVDMDLLATTEASRESSSGPSRGSDDGEGNHRLPSKPHAPSSLAQDNAVGDMHDPGMDAAPGIQTPLYTEGQSNVRRKPEPLGALPLLGRQPISQNAPSGSTRRSPPTPPQMTPLPTPLPGDTESSAQRDDAFDQSGPGLSFRPDDTDTSFFDGMGMSGDDIKSYTLPADASAETVTVTVDTDYRPPSPALSSGSSSFEEITADQFKPKAVFNKGAAPVELDSLENSLESQESDGTRRRSQRLDQQVASPITSSLKGKKARKARKSDRERTVSESGSSKPAQTRFKARLAGDLGIMSREEWLKIVEEEGGMDLMDISADRLSTQTPQVPETIGPIKSRLDDITQQPPPERRGTAIREFDTTLIDDWNERAPFLTKNPGLHREIFEAYIAEKELDAGPITVVNEVDAEGAPPDFEFEYSNNMIYHPDVPDPELGLGCTCEGPCRENSNSCSCLKRQQLYFYDNDIEGFAYDKKGHVKHTDFSIWECSDTCGCPPECMNRVIQHGRSPNTKLELFKTELKGWGVRAKSCIAQGTFIGVYAGELITEDESEPRGELYDEIGKTYLFDVDGYQISHAPPGLDEVDPRLALTARASAERARSAAADGSTGLYSAYTVDAFHLGNYTRYFNHSCDPNLQLTQAYVKDFHPERPWLVIFARRNIEFDEELCISYKGVPDAEPPEPMPAGRRAGGKKGRPRKSKTSAAVHVVPKSLGKASSKDSGPCHCGAPNCDGTMFNYG